MRIAWILGLACLGCTARNVGVHQSPLQPSGATEQVTVDPDDPAIWINPVDPSQSLVVGTNKVAAPQGALVVFDLSGRTRQTIDGIDRPNNVDIEYGLQLGGR